MNLDIENILSSLGQYSFIPNKKSINILFDEVIKSQESCNYYFKNFPKLIKWKENFSKEEKKEIYVNVIKQYHLNIQRKNLIKLSNEIFNEIKGDKKKFDEYFKEYNKQVELKESFDNKNTDNIKKLIQSIENERIEENEKKVQNVFKDIDIFNQYLEDSKFTLEDNLYQYNISEKEYVRGKIIDEEIEKRYLNNNINNNKLINSIRRIINIQNNKEIKIDLFNIYYEDYIKELAKLDSLKLDIISRITDLNTIISIINSIIENKINEFNYKDYGLNEVKEDEINFFKLDPVRLFMILIYEELICKEEQNEYKFNFLTNQFLNEKTLALAKINYLNWVIEKLNESGGKEFVKEFFKFNNNKIESFGKINYLFDVIDNLNGSGKEEFVREFFALDNKKIELLGKINYLYLVIERLNKSGKKKLVEAFFKFDDEKIESLGKINYLYLVIQELNKSGKEKFVKKFFNFDNKKIELLGNIKNLYWVIQELNKSGKEKFVTEFFNFDNNKIELLGKIKDLDDVIEKLNESGGKDLDDVIEKLNESGGATLVREFFNFDNNKIELLGKIINLGDVIEELNGSGGATLVREFLTILKENDLNTINKMLFDDNCKQKDNSKIVEFISSFEKKTTFNLKKVENHSMKGNNIV